MGAYGYSRAQITICSPSTIAESVYDVTAELFRHRVNFRFKINT